MLVMSSMETPLFVESWRWDGWQSTNEHAYAGAVGLDGHLVLAGAQDLGYTFVDDTYASISSSDFGAVKLQGTSGEVLWFYSATSSDGEVDEFFAVDTDSNDDVIMAGFTEGFWTESNSLGYRHMAAVKVDGATGDEIWKFQEGAGRSTTATASLVYEGSTTVFGVGVDGSDDVFLVGSTYGVLVEGDAVPHELDFFVLKLDGITGDEIWRAQSGLSLNVDYFREVEVDSAGDLVAVGILEDGDVAVVLVVKMDGSTGAIVWEYSPVASTTIDFLRTVVIDAEGDVYVAGGEGAVNLQGSTPEAPIVLKLDGETGTLLWTYRGTATSSTVFESVAIDPITGWIVAAGRTAGTWLSGAAQGDYDFAAVVLDSETGDELSRYQDGTTEYDSIKFSGFDSDGGLFFGGYSETVSTEADFVAIKFEPLQGVAPTPSLSSTQPSLSETPAPMEEVSPSGTPAPSPSAQARDTPGSAEAETAVLAEWEVGALAAGGGVLLLLLGLCESLFNGASMIEATLFSLLSLSIDRRRRTLTPFHACSRVPALSRLSAEHQRLVRLPDNT